MLLKMSTFNSRLVPWSTSEHRCGNIIELYICMWCKNIGWACQRRICYHFPNIFSWDEYNICFEKCLIDICRFSLIKNHVHGFAILKNAALVYCIKWDSKNYPTILDASALLNMIQARYKKPDWFTIICMSDDLLFSVTCFFYMPVKRMSVWDC